MDSDGCGGADGDGAVVVVAGLFDGDDSPPDVGKPVNPVEALDGADGVVELSRLLVGFAKEKLGSLAAGAVDVWNKDGAAVDAVAVDPVVENMLGAADVPKPLDAAPAVGVVEKMLGAAEAPNPPEVGPVDAVVEKILGAADVPNPLEDGDFAKVPVVAGV